MRADFVLLEPAALDGRNEAPPRLRGDSATALAAEAILHDEGFIPSAEALEAMAPTNESAACAVFVR